MTKDDSGCIKLTTRALTIIVSTTLAVGAGGSWVTSKSMAGQSAPVTQGMVALEDFNKLEGRVARHHELSAALNATQDAELKALKEQLAAIEGKLDKQDDKLDRLLARR